MPGTWYVSIQVLDYPLSGDTKIGPFETKEAAYEWLSASSRFNSSVYGGWQERGKNYSVRVKNLLDTYMTSPEDYIAREKGR